MSTNFDYLPDRYNSESAKWHYFNKEALPMWVADMDFLSPQPVIDALQERIKHGVFGYPIEYPGLKDAIVEWMAKRHQWEISKEDLYFVPGVITGFNLAVNALAIDGESVLVQLPAYPPFFGVAKNFELEQVETKMVQDADGNYQIDFDEFRNSFKENTSTFLLCNPQNPTGRVFSKEELTQIADICEEKDTYIISDEIHSDLLYSESKHIPIASLSKKIADRTITLIAPSKTFNIAGLKFSVAIVQNEEIRKKMDAAKQGLMGGMNLLGQVAAHAAYAHSEQWLDELLVYLQMNRDFLLDFLASELPDIKMSKPEGTFLAWLDCNESKIEGNPHEFFLNQANVALNDGSWFGKNGNGFVRLNFGCPKSMLEDALNRMKTAYKAI